MSFKHIAAVAELNAWVNAVDDAVKTEVITPEAAYFLARRSGDYSRSFLLGEEVNGELLTDFEGDAILFEQVLNEVKGN